MKPTKLLKFLGKRKYYKEIKSEKDVIGLSDGDRLVGKNGIFIYRDDMLFRSVTKHQDEKLKELKETVEFKLPKVPMFILISSLSLFRKAMEKHDSEAVVLLRISEDHDKYSIVIPEQEVSGMLIKEYDRSACDDGNIVGSIHSHCDSSAFQSGTDHKDEISFPGLHIR